PALRDFLLKGRVRPEGEHPISRFIIAIYKPFVYVALRKPITTILIGVFAVISAIPLYLRLGSEFMPPLNEGDILYMPTPLPNTQIERAKREPQKQQATLLGFPVLPPVFGTIGRAQRPTTPARISMRRRIIQLRPPARCPQVPEERWYSGWAPEPLKHLLRIG